MKRKIILFPLFAMLGLFLVRAVYFTICTAAYKPQTGDVIFHVSDSYQSAAIKIGTLSRYSHCGIIVVENGKSYVIEAENGVEKTPLSNWIKRGVIGHHYRIMRLKDEQEVKISYRSLLGIPYDKHFRFDNGKYYCSELVWELYKKNGILLCEPNELGDYHFLNLPVVQKHIKKRGMILEQKVVPPSDLVQSPLLKTVAYGYYKL